MIGQGISEVMTFAIGVAISPIPIIAVILMLFSAKARVNGPSFLLGWIVGLGAVSGIAYALTNASDAATDSGASDTTSTLKIVLGVVLLALALRNWRHRNLPHTPPKWMQAIDSMTPVKAFALAVLLSAINPKNLILTAGAAAGVGQLGLDTSASIVSIAVFVAIASISIAGPVLYYLVAGASAKEHLDELKGWLEANNATVMAVLLLVFGVVLISKGTGLLST
jgi:hypothetical protein